MHSTTVLPHVLATLLSAAATATLSTKAQTWDTFLPLPDTEDAGVQVLVDPFSDDPEHPAVFIGSTAGSIVRVQPLDPPACDTTPVDQGLATVLRMEFSPADASVYAVGNRPLVMTPPFPRTNPNVWAVRKTAFDSASRAWSAWTEADTFQLGAKESATAYGFASDNVGNLYVCGTASLKGWSHWIVRRKPAAGGPWTTIADFGVKGTAYAYGACVFPGNPSANVPPALFVVGTLNGKWTVQRLEPNGSWTTVDTGPSGGANSIACDSRGHLFVVGTRAGALFPDFSYGWVVRTSTTGGGPGSWQTVLDTAEGYYSSARHVVSDAEGNLWVSGFTGSTMDIQTNLPRWTVVWNRLGESWPESWNARQHPFDNASYSSGARGMATDAFGNVFVVGVVTDLTDGFTTLAGRRIVVQRWVR